MAGFWWVLALAPVAFGALALLSRPALRRRRLGRSARARHEFHLQRERLEMRFLQLAAAQQGADTTDSLDWDRCEFDDDVAYVRSRATGELSALVGMTVARRDSGSPITDIADLLSAMQTGTAIFRFDGKHWRTDGKALLNLNPSEAIRRLAGDMELLDREMAPRG